MKDCTEKLFCRPCNKNVDTRKFIDQLKDGKTRVDSYCSKCHNLIEIKKYPTIEVIPLKRFDFEAKGHSYSFYYDDVGNFIKHLIDMSESDDVKFCLHDVFDIIIRLARRRNQEAERQ